jgi:hypothetical protein
VKRKKSCATGGLNMKLRAEVTMGSITELTEGKGCYEKKELTI